jgi:hypothetical protein
MTVLFLYDCIVLLVAFTGKLDMEKKESRPSIHFTVFTHFTDMKRCKVHTEFYTAC